MKQTQIKKAIRWILILCCCSAFSVSAQQPLSDEGGWRVNIRNADIQAFIGQVADMTGHNFVVDPRVRARDVTVISKKALSAAEVYELFLAVLQVHGYVAVPAGDIIKIVPNTTAKQSNLPLDQSAGADGQGLITRVIPVQNSPVAELVPVLRPLVPQYGHLAAVNSANALIISDHADNIRRIIAILGHIDGAEAEEVEIIALQHAWVGDLIALLENLTPETGRKRARAATDATASATLVADERTNRLIIKGDQLTRDRIRSLVEELDIPQLQTGGVQVIRLKHADAKSLAELLKGFVDGAAAGSKDATATKGGQATPSIQPDEGLNALVVRAEPGLMREIQSVISQLDVRRQQVLIEAAIVEISGGAGQQLGMQWAAGDEDSGVGGINFSNAGTSLNSLLAAAVADTPDISLADGITIGGGERDRNGDVTWGGFLQALVSSSNANLLSTPSVLTLDNQEASIIVGENVPFVTGQSSNTGSGVSNPFTTIQREDVGISLKVTPHISSAETIRLVLEQEASSVKEPDGVNSVDLITSKRSISTTVLANDGETIVLGGLIQDDVEDTVRKVPILGDIPLLGFLFRATSTSTTKKNLMVFLRPTIMQDNEKLVELTRQKYLGISALMFELGGHGNLVRVTTRPLPEDVDGLFSGKKNGDVPAEDTHP